MKNCKIKKETLISSFMDKEARIRADIYYRKISLRSRYKEEVYYYNYQGDLVAAHREPWGIVGKPIVPIHFKNYDDALSFLEHSTVRHI